MKTLKYTPPKHLNNYREPGICLEPGEVVEVDDGTAARLIGLGKLFTETKEKATSSAFGKASN